MHRGRPSTTRTRRAAAGLIAGSFLLVGPLGLLATSAGASPGSSSSASLAQARKDLLTLADMPSGWTSVKNTDTTNTNVGAAQLAHCIGVATALVSENPPSVYSREFQNAGASLTVADNVTVFPSAKNAAAEFAIGASPKLPGCMTTLASGPLKTKLFGKTSKGTTIGSPLVSAVSGPAFGPGVHGYSLSVPVTVQGQTVNVTATQLVAVKGRLGHQLTFTSYNAPFSPALEQQIMQVAAGRL